METIVDADGAARRWRDEAIRQASAPGVRALAVNTGSPDQHRPDQPRPAYKCGGCRLWVNDAHPDWYGHSEHCTRDSDGDSEGGGLLLPGATDIDGWPLAMPDDRLPLGDDDELPEKPSPPALLGLLYPDHTNYLAGDKSTGKTWIALEALAVAVKQLQMRTIWLDAEDTAATFSSRLARLGHRDLTTHPDVKRLNWSDWLDAEPEDRAAVAAWLDGGGWGGHLFIDSGSATESGDSADTFAAWKARHLVHPAATVIEHVAKNPEARFGPAGSLRKGATATGAVLLVEGSPWTAHHEGTVHIRLDKDRPGGIPHRKGELCARVRGTPADGYLVIESLPPGNPDEEIDEAILTAIEASPGITSTGIREAVGGDGKQVSKRLLRLVKNDTIARQPGSRRAQHHYLPDHQPAQSDESDSPRIPLDE